MTLSPGKILRVPNPSHVLRDTVGTLTLPLSLSPVESKTRSFAAPSNKSAKKMTHRNIQCRSKKPSLPRSIFTARSLALVPTLLHPKLVVASTKVEVLAHPRPIHIPRKLQKLVSTKTPAKSPSTKCGRRTIVDAL